MKTPLFSIVGPSGSGKTTLLERLIPELKRRGYRVAVIKHHPHSGSDLDVPGKDTWRLARAGADHVTIVAPDQVMHRRRTEREPTLEEIAAGIEGVDLILTEGYKEAHTPRIEVSRKGRSRPLPSGPEVVALVSEERFDADVPQFDADDVEGLADLIEARLECGPSSSSGSPPQR